MNINVLMTTLLETKDKEIWQKNADLLSELWKQGKLKPDNKTTLIYNYFTFVLKQQHNALGSSSFEVRDKQNFPFPDVYIEYTPTLYKNDEVFMTFDRAVKGVSMKHKGQVITSISGGESFNGDSIYYTIKMEDNYSENTWSYTMDTNVLKVTGLL